MNYCGISCEECQFQSPCACRGCGTPFYGECAVEKCAGAKALSHCGQCEQFPCPALTAAANDPFTGDNGKRLHNLIPLDAIRGYLIGGAAGDALGYEVEFHSADMIFKEYGEKGITAYAIDRCSGKALISDDTQMTLFTAAGLLSGGNRHCVAKAYQDWLFTQTHRFEDRKKDRSRLCDVPELYARRAPGMTCLSALEAARNGIEPDDYIAAHRNHSKGCGGVMRVAPVALQKAADIAQLDMEAAQIAAITHGHPLGYMPAATLCHIINRIVFPGENRLSLKEIVLEARDTTAKLFAGDEHLDALTELIDLAIELSEIEADDLDNIRILGEGWVAEETLAIAIYCSLKYADDFSGGIIAAVNHDGDSDSTGAVTGNILGALIGYHAIEDKWKQNLECADVILKTADDLYLRNT